MGNSPSVGEDCEIETSAWMPGEMVLNPRRFCPTVEVTPGHSPRQTEPTLHAAGSDSSCLAVVVKPELENCALASMTSPEDSVSESGWDSGNNWSDLVRGPTILSSHSGTASSQNGPSTDSSGHDIVNAEIYGPSYIGDQSSESWKASEYDSGEDVLICQELAEKLEKSNELLCRSSVSLAKVVPCSQKPLPPSKSSSSSSSEGSVCKVQVTPCPANSPSKSSIASSSSSSSSGKNSHVNDCDDEEEEEDEDCEDEDDDGEEDEEDCDEDEKGGEEGDDCDDEEDDDDDGDEDEEDCKSNSAKKCEVVVSSCPAKAGQRADDDDDDDDDEEEEDEECECGDDDEDEDDCDDEIEIYDTDYRDEHDAVLIRKKKYRKQLEEDGILVGPEEMHRIYEKYQSYGGGRYSAPDKSTGSQSYWQGQADSPCCGKCSSDKDAGDQDQKDAEYFEGMKKGTPNDVLSPTKSIAYWQDWLFGKFPSKSDPAKGDENKRKEGGGVAGGDEGERGKSKTSENQPTATAANNAAAAAQASKVSQQPGPSLPEQEEAEYFMPNKRRQAPCASCQEEGPKIPPKAQDQDVYFNNAKKSTSKHRSRSKSSSPRKQPGKSYPDSQHKSHTGKNDYERYKSTAGFARVKEGGAASDNRKENGSEKKKKIPAKDQQGGKLSLSESRVKQRKPLAKEQNTEVEARKKMSVKERNAHIDSRNNLNVKEKNTDVESRKNINVKEQKTDRESRKKINVKEQSTDMELRKKMNAKHKMIFKPQPPKDVKKPRPSDDSGDGKDKNPEKSSDIIGKVVSPPKSRSKSLEILGKIKGFLDSVLERKKNEDKRTKSQSPIRRQEQHVAESNKEGKKDETLLTNQSGDAADSVLTDKSGGNPGSLRANKANGKRSDKLLDKSKDGTDNTLTDKSRHRKGNLPNDKSKDEKGNLSNDKPKDEKGNTSNDNSKDGKGNLSNDKSKGGKGNLSNDESKDEKGNLSNDKSKDLTGNLSRDKWKAGAGNKFTDRLRARKGYQPNNRSDGEKSNHPTDKSNDGINNAIADKSGDVKDNDMRNQTSRDVRIKTFIAGRKDVTVKTVIPRSREATSPVKKEDETIKSTVSITSEQKRKPLTREDILSRREMIRIKYQKSLSQADDEGKSESSSKQYGPSFDKPNLPLTERHRLRMRQREFSTEGHATRLTDNGEKENPVGRKNRGTANPTTPAKSPSKERILGASNLSPKDSKESLPNVPQKLTEFITTENSSKRTDQTKSPDGSPAVDGRPKSSCVDPLENPENPQKLPPAIDVRSKNGRPRGETNATTQEVSSKLPSENVRSEGGRAQGETNAETQEVSPMNAEEDKSPDPESPKPECSTAFPGVTPTEKPRGKSHGQHSMKLTKFTPKDCGPPTKAEGAAQGQDAPSPNRRADETEDMFSPTEIGGPGIYKVEDLYRPTEVGGDEPFGLNSQKEIEVSVSSRREEDDISPDEDSKTQINTQSQDVSALGGTGAFSNRHSMIEENVRSHDYASTDLTDSSPESCSVTHDRLNSQNISPTLEINKTHVTHSAGEREVHNERISSVEGIISPPGTYSTAQEKEKSQNEPQTRGIDVSTAKQSTLTRIVNDDDDSPKEWTDSSPDSTSINLTNVRSPVVSQRRVVTKSPDQHFIIGRKLKCDVTFPTQRGANMSTDRHFLAALNAKSEDVSPQEANGRPPYICPKRKEKFKSDETPRAQKGLDMPPYVDFRKKGDKPSYTLAPTFGRIKSPDIDSTQKMDESPDSIYAAHRGVNSQSTYSPIQSMDKLSADHKPTTGCRVKSPNVTRKLSLEKISPKKFTSLGRIKSPYSSDVTPSQSMEKISPKKFTTLRRIKSPDISNVTPSQSMERISPKKFATLRRIKSPDISNVTPSQSMERISPKKFPTLRGIKSPDNSATERLQKSPNIRSTAQRKMKSRDASPRQRKDTFADNKTTKRGEVKSPDISSKKGNYKSPDKKSVTLAKQKSPPVLSTNKLSDSKSPKWQKVKSPNATPVQSLSKVCDTKTSTRGRIKSPDISTSQRMDRPSDKKGTKQGKVKSPHSSRTKLNDTAPDKQPISQAKKKTMDRSQMRKNDVSPDNHTTTHQKTRPGTTVPAQPRIGYKVSTVNSTDKCLSPSIILKHGTETSPSVYMHIEGENLPTNNLSPNQISASAYLQSREKLTSQRVLPTEVEKDVSPVIHFPTHRTQKSPSSDSLQEGRVTLPSSPQRNYGKYRPPDEGTVMKNQSQDKEQPPDGERTVSSRKQIKTSLQDASLVDKRKVMASRKQGKDRLTQVSPIDDGQVLSLRKQRKDRPSDAAVVDEDRSSSPQKQWKERLPNAYLKDKGKAISPRKGTGILSDVSAAHEDRAVSPGKMGKGKPSEFSLTGERKVPSPRKYGKSRWTDIMPLDEHKVASGFKKQGKDRQTDEKTATSPQKEGKERPSSADPIVQRNFSFPSEKQIKHPAADDSSKSEEKSKTERTPKQESSISSHTGHPRRTETGRGTPVNLGTKTRSGVLSQPQDEKERSIDTSKVSYHRNRRGNTSPRSTGHTLSFEDLESVQAAKVKLMNTAYKRQSRCIPSAVSATEVAHLCKATVAIAGQNDQFQADVESEPASDASAPPRRRSYERRPEDSSMKENVHQYKDGGKNSAVTPRKKVVSSKSDNTSTMNSSPTSKRPTVKSERDFSLMKNSRRRSSMYAAPSSQFSKSISKTRDKTTSFDKTNYVSQYKSRTQDRAKLANQRAAELESEDRTTKTQKEANAKPKGDHGQGESLNKACTRQDHAHIKGYNPDDPKDAEMGSQFNSWATDEQKESVSPSTSSAFEGNFDFWNDHSANREGANVSPLQKGVQKLKEIYFSSREKAAELGSEAEGEEETSPGVPRPVEKGFLPPKNNQRSNMDSQPQGDAEEKLLLQDFVGRVPKVSVKVAKPEKIKLESIPPSHDEVVSIYTYEDSTRSQEEIVYYSRVLNIDEDDDEDVDNDADTKPDDSMDSTIVLFTSNDKAENSQIIQDSLPIEPHETTLDESRKPGERDISKDNPKKSRISIIKEKFEMSTEDSIFSGKDHASPKIVTDGIPAAECEKPNQEAREKKSTSHVEAAVECFEKEIGDKSQENINLEKIISKEKGQAKIGTSAWDISFPFRVTREKMNAEQYLEKPSSKTDELENHDSTKEEHKPDSFNDYLQNMRENHFRQNRVKRENASRKPYLLDCKSNENFSDNAVTGLLAGTAGGKNIKTVGKAAEKAEHNEGNARIEGVVTCTRGANQEASNSEDGIKENAPSTNGLPRERINRSPSHKAVRKEAAQFMSSCPPGHPPRGIIPGESSVGNSHPRHNALKSYKEDKRAKLDRIHDLNEVRPFLSLAGVRSNGTMSCWTSQSSPDVRVRLTSHRTAVKLDARQQDNPGRMQRPQSWQSESFSHSAIWVAGGLRSISDTEIAKLLYERPDWQPKLGEMSDTKKALGRERDSVAVLPDRNKNCCSEENSPPLNVTETEPGCFQDYNFYYHQKTKGNANRNSVYDLCSGDEFSENYDLMHFRSPVENDACLGCSCSKNDKTADKDKEAEEKSIEETPVEEEPAKKRASSENRRTNMSDGEIDARSDTGSDEDDESEGDDEELPGMLDMYEEEEEEEEEEELQNEADLQEEYDLQDWDWDE